MTGSSFSREDSVSREYFHHSSAQRINTDIVLVEAIRKQYPNLELVAVPRYTINLIAYASAGFATATPIQDAVRDPVYSSPVSLRAYIPPAKRLNGGSGFMLERVVFGRFAYKWNDEDFIVYVAEGRDGDGPYPSEMNHFILGSSVHKVDELIKSATLWIQDLHDEVWVFDQGYWQKSRELWESVHKSSWENVILDEGMKKALVTDAENFFNSQETYQNLKVPWKRGVIYHGPPGNGKTISIKAMMHSLYDRGSGEGDSRLTVPTLYVRSLSSYGGPEFAISLIFEKAREQAPCLLVFEDIDSLIGGGVRSYFLNAVDGLQSNDGILMIASTNHLDRLDPGIAKRPSRFDRKFYFPDPNFDERTQYARFWQGKLKDNKDLSFPDKLCLKIAEITDKFSFAYMQEAFIASLLAIAARGGKDEIATEKLESDIDGLELWKEMQKQVKILREEAKDEGDLAEQTTTKATAATAAPAMPFQLAHRSATEGSRLAFRDELDALSHSRREMFMRGPTSERMWGADHL